MTSRSKQTVTGIISDKCCVSECTDLASSQAWKALRRGNVITAASASKTLVHPAESASVCGHNEGALGKVLPGCNGAHGIPTAGQMKRVRQCRQLTLLQCKDCT